MLKFKKDGILKAVLKDEASEPEGFNYEDIIPAKDDTDIEIPEDIDSIEEILEKESANG